MIGQFEAACRKVRRWLSRSEWAIRLLRLSVSDDTATAPGLVMVQIDGLSRRQLQRAMRRGRMPFLRHLLQRERYRLHAQYSGLPASTPAVQAELFYGVRGAVPAFNFVDRETGQIFKMYDPKCAAEIERRLETRGPGLLQGGSAYNDIFSGGAAEAHFCAAALGWGKVFRPISLIAVPFLVISRIDLIVRIAVLIVVESVLAVIDCVRGTLTGKGFLEEAQFVLGRVGICILLRELVVDAAKIDIARGLPIIHVNLVGYDEQAHRRGPSSPFAQWSLKGIDSAIARLWHAAHRSARRTYDVWVYSDHGQEDAQPYRVLHHKSVEQAITEVFDDLIRKGEIAEHALPSSKYVPPRLSSSSERVNDHQSGVQAQRMRWIGNWILDHLTASRPTRVNRVKGSHVIVTAMGSLGHVYPPHSLSAEHGERMARELISRAGIPLVLAAAGSDTAYAWTSKGRFILPTDAERFFGANYPYREEIARDLVDICLHPSAGSLVISGWRLQALPVSFPLEYGTHTGPGREETGAFALLPNDAPLPPTDRAYLRPWDLREAAHHLLGRSIIEAAPEPEPHVGSPRTLRLMTYNIHSCIGMDGKVSPERIARVIARHHPDVVALQEIDVERERTGRVDQANVLAQKLKMAYQFQPAVKFHDGQFGNAILSRYPMRVIRAANLPAFHRRLNPEPRSALWVAVDVNGVSVQVIDAHMSLWTWEGLLQAEALLGPDWLGHPDCTDPRIVCGDFNALPDSLVYRRFSRKLRDAQRVLMAHQPRSTWWGRYPLTRIDHVFIGERTEVLSIEVPWTELEKLASDHLPLIAEIVLASQEIVSPAPKPAARTSSHRSRS